MCICMGLLLFMMVIYVDARMCNVYMYEFVVVQDGDDDRWVMEMLLLFAMHIFFFFQRHPTRAQERDVANLWDADAGRPESDPHRGEQKASHGQDLHEPDQVTLGGLQKRCARCVPVPIFRLDSLIMLRAEEESKQEVGDQDSGKKQRISDRVADRTGGHGHDLGTQRRALCSLGLGPDPVGRPPPPIIRIGPAVGIGIGFRRRCR